MRDFFGQPGIARHHGDAQDFRLRGLDQQQNRLLITAGGAGCVLIDDDLALVFIIILTCIRAFILTL